VLLPQLHPVVFIDGGDVHSRTSQPSETLLSAGVGARWTYEKLEALVDVAHVFERNTQNPVDVHTRLHLLLSYRF
jgi:hemolysin activation/secretion protein